MEICSAVQAATLPAYLQGNGPTPLALHSFIFVLLQGEQTYTPRLIALDLPGSLKTLKQEGTLYDTQTGAKDVPAWYVIMLLVLQRNAHKFGNFQTCQL